MLRPTEVLHGALPIKPQKPRSLCLFYTLWAIYSKKTTKCFFMCIEMIKNRQPRQIKHAHFFLLQRGVLALSLQI